MWKSCKNSIFAKSWDFASPCPFSKEYFFILDRFYIAKTQAAEQYIITASIVINLIC